MKLFYSIFLLLSISVLAQNPKLEIRINSITSEKINPSNDEYRIDYQIENLTNEEVYFFLIPNALIANSASSLTLFPVYKMYQNGKFEDMDGPFFEYESENELKLAEIEDKNSSEAKALIKRIQNVNSLIAMDYYKKYQQKGGKSTNFNWVFQNQRLLNNIITLKPKELKKYTIKTIWNKNRFIKNDDLEFYLNENDTFEIELILDLKTTLFKDQLSDEDLQKITSNQNFINGTFKSNKVKVTFND